MVRKRPDLNAVDYYRELEAVAKFSHTKVSLSNFNLWMFALSDLS
jgi:hypothetical protein